MPETVAESVLVGVGVDAEDVRRFAKIAAGAPRWRLVFTEREAGHLAAQPRPALAFCAAFCAKEAVCKALGERYPFVECECRFPGGGRSLEVIAAPALLESRGIAGIRVHLREHYPDERGECVVEAYLYRGAPEAAEALPAARSRLKSLAVAAAARGRAQIEARHFSPAELADLGERSVQSVAGFLALKSALVVLWADAGAPLPVPRDFELRHRPGGAPVVVSAPPGPEGVLVSISHTRAWAYGLAALCPA